VPGVPAFCPSPEDHSARAEGKESALATQPSAEPISPEGPGPSWETAQAVTAVVQDLAGEFSLRPLLERILLRCTQLLNCDAGSICSVDEAAGTYRKEADIGIRCQSGRVFPLSEGMTGAVVSRRGPVWFDSYEEVRGGHVNAADRATLRCVIGVPLEWRGSIIGACIVFSRDDMRTFGPGDAQLLQLFAKHAAVALTNARMHDVAEERARAAATAAERERLLREVYGSLNQGLVGVISQLGRAEDALGGGCQDVRPLVTAAHLEARNALSQIRRTMLGLMDAGVEDRDLEDALADEVDWARRAGRLDVRLVVAGAATPLEPAQAHEILRIAQEALTNIVQHADATLVRLGIAYESAGVSLLVQDDGRGFDAHNHLTDAGWGLQRMSDRARMVGGVVVLDSVPGWGTSLRARFPHTRPQSVAVARPLRVLVVDPHPLIRAGVGRLLAQSVVDIDVVGEAAGAEQATALQEIVGADVVVASLRLGDEGESDGVELTRRLVEAGRGAVLCLSEPGDDHLVAAALRVGAHGCLDKGVDGPALAQAVVASAHGQAFLSVTALQSLQRGLRHDGSATLTGRELEVRALLEKGLPDKLIARELMISVKTVEKHVGSLLRKARVRNRTELVATVHRR
jgi:DNA-binding NarL/FixJ family response regulator/signal transduction histidine kinase